MTRRVHPRGLAERYEPTDDIAIGDDSQQRAIAAAADNRNLAAVMLDHGLRNLFQGRVRRATERIRRHDFFDQHCDLREYLFAV